MTDILLPAGYNLLMGLSANSVEVELQHVTAFLGQRVAALALTGSLHAERTRSLLAHAGIPVVEIPVISGPLIDMAVGYSTGGASNAMVEHLAQCGYRRVAYVSLPVAGNQLAQERLKGYRRAVADLNLDPDPALVVESRYSPAGSARAFVELLARRPDLEAVFCASDMQAIGCLLEARRRGIRVPEDIGIAGYDDIDLAQEFVPALTTVRFDRYEMGRAAARLMLARIGGETPPQTVVDVGFEVVPRASTKRPQAGQASMES
jgi:LacI family gluconate utilization system Gnt-I transcriptional repressor